MSETLTQGEQEAIDGDRVRFETYCKRLQGYVPLRTSPLEARLGRAYLAWSAAAQKGR